MPRKSRSRRSTCRGNERSNPRANRPINSAPPRNSTTVVKITIIVTVRQSNENHSQPMTSSEPSENRERTTNVERQQSNASEHSESLVESEQLNESRPAPSGNSP